TQILHFDGINWNGYTYAWNDDQTDASLVGAKGEDRTLSIIDAKAPGKKREQRWHYPSRAECATCHNPWAGFTLAFNVPQLNRDHDYAGVRDNQLRALQHAGLVSFHQKNWNERNSAEKTLTKLPTARLANPHDKAAGIGERARSYLHVNCSH